MAEDKLKIGVIFGGRSGEHAVSLKSARFVLSSLDPDKYEITQIGITRQGEWWTGSEALEVMIEEKTNSLTPAAILPTPSRQGLFSLDGADALELLTELDVVFPVLHGTFGEDGTLQGLLEMAELAYVGSGVTGSAVGMDKAIFADLMRANQIPIVETVLVLRSELEKDTNLVLDRVEKIGDYPFFVKPANLGSSVGVSKTTSRSDLLEGLMEAAQYDRRIIVQVGLNVREIEVSVMGNEEPRASVCGEVLPEAEFYSYDAKYHDDRSQTQIPADIPEDTAKQIQEMAIKAYKVCDLAGLARVDFFIENDTQDIYLNELNTMPGFTEISMYPMLWEASGVSKQELVDQLVDYSLQRKSQRDSTIREFRRSG